MLVPKGAVIKYTAYAVRCMVRARSAGGGAQMLAAGMACIFDSSCQLRALLVTFARVPQSLQDIGRE